MTKEKGYWLGFNQSLSRFFEKEGELNWRILFGLTIKRILWRSSRPKPIYLFLFIIFIYIILFYLFFILFISQEY